jgi:hypothetical protein
MHATLLFRDATFAIIDNSWIVLREERVAAFSE